MKTNFQIEAIDGSEYAYLFDLEDGELKAKGAEKIIASVKPGFPCVVSLEDAEIGEEVLLFAYDHLNSNSPFQSKGPVFIRKGAVQAMLKKNEIPKNLAPRLLSLRAYDAQDMMVNAKTVKGTDLDDVFQEFFESENALYIHIHIAGPGCYNCLAQRL